MDKLTEEAILFFVSLLSNGRLFKEKNLLLHFKQLLIHRDKQEFMQVYNL